MVVDPDGIPCPCGRRGCWERYASGSGLGRLGRDAAESGRGNAARSSSPATPSRCGASTWPTAAREGDAEALEVFRQFGWWAALGIANLVDLLDPAIVVVGGGLVEPGDVDAGPDPMSRSVSWSSAADRRPEVADRSSRARRRRGRHRRRARRLRPGAICGSGRETGLE